MQWNTISPSLFSCIPQFSCVFGETDWMQKHPFGNFLSPLHCIPNCVRLLVVQFRARRTVSIPRVKGVIFSNFLGHVTILPSCFFSFWKDHHCCSELQTITLLSFTIPFGALLPKENSLLKFQRPVFESLFFPPVYRKCFQIHCLQQKKVHSEVASVFC